MSARPGFPVLVLGPMNSVLAPLSRGIIMVPSLTNEAYLHSSRRQASPFLPSRQRIPGASVICNQGAGKHRSKRRVNGAIVQFLGGWMQQRVFNNRKRATDLYIEPNREYRKVETYLTRARVDGRGEEQVRGSGRLEGRRSSIIYFGSRFRY
jgi:hypothetical protein